MLTSSANQYLRPEYLTPLPTTLDAKKSPLALLAQTCSQIGVDPPTGKSLLPQHDKSNKSSKTSSDSSSSREKSSPSSGFHSSATSASPKFSSSSSESTKSNSSFKPYESCIIDTKSSSSPESQQQRVPSVHSNSGRSRTPGNSNNKRCSSNQSASSSGGRAMTPQGRKSSTPNNSGSNESNNTPRESPSARITVVSDLTSPRSGSSNSPKQPSYSPLSQEQSLSSFRPSPLISSTSTHSGATTTTTPSAAAYGLPYPPQLTHMDPMTASSLMAQHHAAAALKNGLTAAHPYLSYARMKTPSGADTLVPVCRDPYCTGCQLNSHLLAATSQASAVNSAKIATSQAGGGSAPCPAGCAQCDHKPMSAAAAAAAAAAASSPYAAYAHAQLVALAAASQVPYVCNWIGSDTAYCGKRFSTSDELLQHFRSHTAPPGVAVSSAQESSAAAAAATTAAALSLLSPPGLAPGHPLLSRTYPTPPLSPLAAGRYHPYGKSPYGAPLSSLGLPLPPPQHHPLSAAGLPPYFSPYSLYAGSRLGAASGMHP